MSQMIRAIIFLIAIFIITTSIISAEEKKSVIVLSFSTTFSQSKLWDLINEFQINHSDRSYIQTPKVCAFAEKRIVETRTEWSHAGFYNHLQEFTYTKLGENIIKGYASEKATLQAWLASPSHRKNLTDAYRFSCLRCEGNRCVQIFADF